MKKLVHTISVLSNDKTMRLSAQGCESWQKLLARLMHDDPIWRFGFTLEYSPKWKKRYFRRGLAIRAFA